MNFLHLYTTLLDKNKIPYTVTVDGDTTIINTELFSICTTTGLLKTHESSSTHIVDLQHFDPVDYTDYLLG